MRYICGTLALSLHAALREKLKMSDAEFARRCGRHRTEIWNYRTRRRVPNGQTAIAIRDALKRLGVAMTLEELIGGPKSKQAA